MVISQIYIQGTLKPAAIRQHSNTGLSAQSKASLSHVSRAILTPAVLSKRQRHAPQASSTTFTGIFPLEAQGFHAVSKKSSNSLFYFLSKLCSVHVILSFSEILQHHAVRMFLWLRCKMVAIESCGACSHPVFSAVVVVALSQVYCLMLPKSSDLSIPSEKGPGIQPTACPCWLNWMGIYRAFADALRKY